MLWGGRFKSSINELAMKFSSSLDVDIRLIEEDIQGSIAHVTMLAAVGILTESESKTIRDGLSSVLTEYQSGSWKPTADLYEDVHSAVETRLTELVGSVAGKLHTGRSRNDQVATDVRLWMRKVAAEMIRLNEDWQKSLLKKAESHQNTLMPGYTHLQRGQPISLAYHLLAFAEMAERDINRWKAAQNAVSLSPLGAGALAGSTLPLDRNLTAKLMGFEGPTAHALDTVSDRDFMLDALHAVSTGMIHLSRQAEELVLWSTKEWNFIRLADEVTTGSSLMPQKKNPDMAELIRGKSGRTTGNHVAFLTMMKALPLSYNRDLQEDKRLLFDSIDTYSDCLQLMTMMIDGMEVKTDRFIDDLKHDFSLATDLADWLVVQGMPFREAHHLVGKVVQWCEENGKTLPELNSSDLGQISTSFTESAVLVLNPITCLENKKTVGSPNPDLVAGQIQSWKNRLKM
ncbi:MAG: argininosuccinate lyase [Bacteroidetes bacterium]|nr:argininosuccinate lyase [Bacteroidota bacterium]